MSLLIWLFIIIAIPFIIIMGVFYLCLSGFPFYHILSSVIPTPWTHMVLDVLSCY